MSADFSTLSLLAPAFMAGAIIAAAHVPLGLEVLKRGIIFLDLAVAQFAALGMVAFHVFIDTHHMSPTLIAAGSLSCGLGLALACAMGLHILEKHTRHHQEALIGSAFIFAASLSIIIVAGNPNSHEHMNDILAGQILWITWHDLAIYSPVFGGVAAIWYTLRRYRPSLFYILFALTIPFSVTMIGVYLVFASLILPALATVHLKRYRTATGYVMSIISFSLGLVASYIWDIPSGPAIVMAMFAVAISLYITTQYRKRERENTPS